MDKFDNNLFKQGNISNHIFKNRYMVGPMTRVSSEADGTPNERVHQYYVRYAKGGFSTVITEGTYPDTTYSQGYENQAGLATEKHRDAWKPIVEDIKSNGSKAIVQLMHAGAQSQGSYYNEETIAPSPYDPNAEKVGAYGGEGNFQKAREMTQGDIDEANRGFVQASIYAAEAGFDGIELHGANGYLLDQFLSEGINKRTDKYGGSVEKRLTFLLEIIKEVREAIGDDMVLGIRISQIKVVNPNHKWSGGEKEAETIFGILGRSEVDYIHISDDDAAEPGFGEGTMTMAAAAKAYGGVSVITAGNLADPDKAAGMIDREECDYVAVARAALANPDAPNRIQKGKPLDAFNPDEIMSPKAYVKDTELSREMIPNE